MSARVSWNSVIIQCMCSIPKRGSVKLESVLGEERCLGFATATLLYMLWIYISLTRCLW